MRYFAGFRIACLVLALGLTLTSAHAKVGGWGAVDGVFNIKGTLKGNVYVVRIPRSDLQVNIADTPLHPDCALTTQLTFQPSGKDVRVFGDLVLLDSEVTPVMRRLLAGGFTVSAVHDELANESPRIDHVFVRGHGSAEGLADSIKAALALTGTPFRQPPLFLNQPPWKGLDFTMNAKGERTGMVIRYVFPRAEKIMLDGVELPAEGGSATTLSFQDNNGDAAVAGSFALIASELSPVSKILAENGITITSVHSDFSGETPELTYVSFWAEDDPLIVARTLRTALDKTNLKKK